MFGKQRLYRLAQIAAVSVTLASLTISAQGLGSASHAAAATGSGKPLSSGPITPSPAASAEPSAASVPDACQPPSCYNYSTMGAYLDKMLPLVNGFFVSRWPHMALPAIYYYVAHNEHHPTACRTIESNEFAYCPLDHGVYLGQDMAWPLYQVAGPIAPLVGLAHEMGHNVQTRVGIRVPPSDAPDVLWVVYENQADCISGAWLRYAFDQGILAFGALKSINNLIIEIADTEAQATTQHGDISQRFRALMGGMIHALPSCNRYYPATPIF
jgi:Putative neutral zinc metallopeptidase